MLILSNDYPELRIGGLVKFSAGKAEVSDPVAIERLRAYAHLGVVVPEAAKGAPTPSKRSPRKQAE